VAPSKLGVLNVISFHVGGFRWGELDQAMDGFPKPIKLEIKHCKHQILSKSQKTNSKANFKTIRAGFLKMAESGFWDNRFTMVA
jgi:hypothetical protein